MLSLQVLNLSNCKLLEKSAMSLFETVLLNTKIESLDLSRNQNIGFKFGTHVIHKLKQYTSKDLHLRQLNVKYCQISQICIESINDLLERKKSNKKLTKSVEPKSRSSHIS